MLRSLQILALCSWLATPAAAEGAQRVLILFSNEPLLPAVNALGDSLQTSLQAGAPGRLEIYTEFLDAARFPDPDQEARLAAFVSGKYAPIPMDLVIAVGPQALSFVTKRQATLFPNVPVVFSAISEETLRSQALPLNSTGVTIRFDPVETLELALRLQPRARQVFIVTGSAPFDKRWEAVAREKFAAYGERLQLTYLSGLPLSQLLQTLAKLPPDAIVIYLSMIQDETGERFIPQDVAAQIGNAASAPVYGNYETYLGHGIVGGYIDSFQVLGEQTARVALRVLAGEKPETIPRSDAGTHSLVVDWRQLRRWGLSESQLPADTVVRFKEPSLWTHYKGQILAITLVLALQSLLILALLIQGRRRRRAEQSLRESEARMKLATVSANLGLWRLEAATNRVWATEHCRNLLGLDSDAALTREALINAVHPEERQKAQQCFEEALAQGKSTESEYRIVGPEGRLRWILSRTQAISNGSGNSMRLTGIIIDITERKRAEEALRESEERYRNVVETQTELICRYLPDTTLTFVNDAYCRYFNRTRDELIGTRFSDLIPPAARAETLRHVASLIAAPRNQAYEHAVLLPDGTIGWQQWTDHVILDVDGQVFEIQGIGRDVTELKRAEMEAQERRQEVTHLTRVATLGELSGALAHELNQPLTAILANAQAARVLLARDPVDLAEVREILDDIMEDDNRAGEVVRRVRSLLKKGQPRFQQLSVNEIATDVLDLAHSELIAHNVAVTTQLAAGLPTINGDRIQLEQVMLNLIVNACEAMNNGVSQKPSLRVSTSYGENGYVELSVSDNGHGIAREAADQLFQPFYTTKEQGLGLGLSISRTIVAAHGGRLWAVNNSDRGATFCVNLPVNGGNDGR